MAWDRVGLAAGGVVCLAVTPFLALAYFPAFGSAEELPPPWADWFTWPQPVTGDPVEVYNTYGVLFGAGLLLAAVSLGGLVHRSTAGSIRRGWHVIVAGLAAVAAGSLIEYGPEMLYGFGLEIVGVLVIMIGTIVLGVAVRREAAVSWWASALVGVSGTAAVVAGTALVGHLPSGPALVPVAACVALAFTGLPSPMRVEAAPI